jgi:two-component system, OmpR family, response regulator
VAKILVVEDDEKTASEIAGALEAVGHSTIRSGDGLDALERATSEAFDAVSLDRMLPGLDGLALVSELRQRGIAVPVLMLSALSDVDERIAGLRAGGDDYLVKPFAPEEMVTRIEVLLRRGQDRVAPTTIDVGAIHIDLIRREVLVGGEPVRLLHKEYRLLEFLARHQGQIVSRRILFEQVWGYYFDPGANLINVHIARLRKKLDRPGRPAAITTVKGEGYRLDAV